MRMMITIKSYTDLDQSHKLAEFIPLESADCFYAENVIITELFITYLNGERNIPAYKGAVPCWSLVALFDIIKKYCKRFELTLRADKKYNIFAIAPNDFIYHSFDEYSEGVDNLIDACYEMILKLKEKNLL